MSLTTDLGAFSMRLENAIHKAMTTTVTEAAKGAMQEALDEKVYGVYTPVYYERKMDNGGLRDPENMRTDYDSSTMTLTMWNDRRDEETGRAVAPVVESGRGYTYFSPGARHFHRYTEELMGKGVFENALEFTLRAEGFDVKKV